MKKREVILKILRESSKPMTCRNILEAVGGEYNATQGGVNVMLSEMYKARMVTRAVNDAKVYEYSLRRSGSLLTPAQDLARPARVEPAAASATSVKALREKHVAVPDVSDSVKSILAAIEPGPVRLVERDPEPTPPEPTPPEIPIIMPGLYRVHETGLVVQVTEDNVRAWTV